MKVRESTTQHLGNQLGIKGWVWGGRYTLERYLYTLQRLSGLALILYGLLHLAMNGFRLGGPASWSSLMNLFNLPAFGVGEYLVMAGFIYHSANGARLMLQELGFLLGRPKPPVYPYSDALRKKRSLVLAMGALVIVLFIAVLVRFVSVG